MEKQKQTLRKPNWWQLYAVLPVMVGLLVLNVWFPLSSEDRLLFEIGIVLVTFGLMGLWVHINQADVLNDDLSRDRTSFKIIEYDPEPTSDSTFSVPTDAERSVYADTRGWNVNESRNN